MKIAAVLLLTAAATAAHGAAPWQPKIVPARFVERVDHPYFPLPPGRTWKYVERHGRSTSEITTSVSDETRLVLGVRCTVVHDRETRAGRVIEDTRDWYAQDRDGNVWYFGEDTHEFRPDGSSTAAGSWEAGRHGAQPGILLPAHPAPGRPYRQEFLRGEAEDMAQVLSSRATARLPDVRFDDCVLTREWSPLEPGSERKWYARGVGLVRAESTSGEVTELVSVSH